MAEFHDLMRSEPGQAVRKEFAEKIAVQERAVLFAAQGQGIESCRYQAGVLYGLTAALNFLNEHQ